MTMRCQLLWTATVALILTALSTAAPPLDSTHHHLDMIKGLPSELGTDDEVRQLLDLKVLAAQRDLGNLKQGQHQQHLQDSSPTPAPVAAADTAPTDASNKGATEDQQKKDEKEHERKEEEKDVVNKKITAETTGSEEDHGHHETERHLEEDHVQLKRQQLSRPHARYTPLDLALYVYKTGDEEGVSLAIQELIAEGLMTAEEALNYLREVRENLQYLNLQDEQEQEEEREVSENVLKPLIKKNSLPLPLTEMTLADPETMLTPEVDYDGLMERLRSQDEISTEYSLEEVIYQLAKILFKQAMHREGDIGSEKALQEVAALLEKEAARGAITPEVEKKVLDVMVNSLVDSITEREFPSASGPMIGGQGFKLSNQSPFPLGNSAMIGGSNFKPPSDLFQLSKSTTKRETPEEKKKTVEDKH